LYQIEIRTGDSHGFVDEARQRINLPGDVKIGNHVWIEQQVLVLKVDSIGGNFIISVGLEFELTDFQHCSTGWGMATILTKKGHIG
jgi:hypothetical protein